MGVSPPHCSWGEVPLAAVGAQPSGHVLSGVDPQWGEPGCEWEVPFQLAMKKSGQVTREGIQGLVWHTNNQL